MSTLAAFLTWLRQRPALQLQVFALVAALVFGAGWLHEHDARVRDAARLTDALTRDRQTIAAATAYAKAASAQVVHDSVRVVQRTTRLDTLWQQVPETLRTKAETVDVLDRLPAIRRASDSTTKACLEFVQSCADFRRASDSLVQSLRAENTTLSKALSAERPSRIAGLVKWLEIGGAAYVGFRAGRR